MPKDNKYNGHMYISVKNKQSQWSVNQLGTCTSLLSQGGLSSLRADTGAQQPFQSVINDKSNKNAQAPDGGDAEDDGIIEDKPEANEKKKKKDKNVR